MAQVNKSNKFAIREACGRRSAPCARPFLSVRILIYAHLPSHAIPLQIN